MREFSIRTVRALLVAGLVALLAVVAVFVGYGRYKARLLLKGLPERFGVHITQESDNVTYSQSLKGRTVYTIHAAKQIERADGKYTLRNVGIVMYGKTGDRADRIHGNEFEYDQKAGVLTAVGEVFIDLGGPTGTATTAKGTGSAPAKELDEEARMIHVKTSGMVFRQNDRTATTDQLVEFKRGETSGTSVGAMYDSGSGVVVLGSAVRMSELRTRGGGGAESGRPMVLTASRAEMDRVGNVVKLEAAKVVSATERGEQSAAAEHALVHITPEGAPKDVEAQGAVTLTADRDGGSRGAGRDVVTSDRMTLELNEAGQARAAHLWGGVRLKSDSSAQAGGATRLDQGQASDAVIAFDEQGRPVHAVFTGGVKVDERAGVIAGAVAGAGTRHLEAAKLELALGGGGKERVVVKGAVASGGDGARLQMVDAGQDKDRRGTKTTAVRADVLTGRFATVPGAAKGASPQTQVVGLDGVGKTFVEQIARDGKGGVELKETSAGDTLKVDFGTKAAGGGGTGSGAGPGTGSGVGTQIERAEQRGSVTVVRETRKKPVAAGPGQKQAAADAQGMDVVRAKADAGVYEQAADRLTMSGAVQVTDPESALFADRVEMMQTSGDATAQGSVRVTYVQESAGGAVERGAGAGGQQEPVHVTADRAVSHKATGVTEFFAAAGARAKMWQGGSQVEAPVLDFDRSKKTVVARGEQGTEDGAVRTVLVETPADGSQAGGRAGGGGGLGKGAGSKAAGLGFSGPVRVTSREMVYRDAVREVAFRGAVKVVDKDGTLRSDSATVYLAAPAQGADKSAGKAEEMTLGGRLDHIVALGNVVVEQPGRRATGERLVYTAGDETSVLTGTKGAPPKMVDEAQGTVSGAALRFRSGDDSVVVLGADEGTETRRVRSETKMKQ